MSSRVNKSHMFPLDVCFQNVLNSSLRFQTYHLGLCCYYIFWKHLLLPFLILGISCLPNLLCVQTLKRIPLGTVTHVAPLPHPTCAVNDQSVTSLRGLTSFSEGALTKRRSPSLQTKTRQQAISHLR